MSLECLIFDVDGTLADTERDGHRVAFNQAFEDAGLGWHWDVNTYGELLAVTGGKERMRHYVEDYQPEYEKPGNFDAMVVELHAAKTRHYTGLMREACIPLRPGVERLLKEARAQGLRLAIATTTTPANVSALLTSTLGENGESWFEVIGAGDVVPAKKPAPDIYDYVLKKLDLPAGACLAFEDSENGIRSSRGAGLKTIITVNGYTETHDFNGAEIVLDNLGEPDQPARVIAGAGINGASCVDITTLKQLHSRS
ncbi:MAG: HAD family hydrolase [Acidiferrobacterales bacterium]